MSAHFIKDDRFSDAIRNNLEREPQQAADTTEWFRDQSALKPALTEEGKR